MPVELAMPLFLTRDDFPSRKTPNNYKRPLRPCFHAPLPQPTLTDSLVKCRKSKKQVSFADHKGLALAAVKIFSEFDDPIDVPLSIQELFSSALAFSEDEDKLVLDFAQPCADYLQFRQRLERNFVCLEHCLLKDRAIAGTVKVKNLSFEKSVRLRATFDAWRSHVDVECQYVRDTYSGSEWDTFSFELELRGQATPRERVEFAVYYEVNGNVYWDSNHGQNYKIVHASLKNDDKNQHHTDWDVPGDKYGSPRCSHGIFPEWRSYVGYEDLGPYY